MDQPPPGVKPNFVNPPNIEKEFYVDLILCLTISVLVVCMRMWTKARLMRKVQIEDWVCVLTLHIRIELTTFGFVIFTVKLAILLQYLRVFCPAGIRDATFWGCHTLIWLNFIFYAVSVFLIIFSCNPIEKFGNRGSGRGMRLIPRRVYYTFKLVSTHDVNYYVSVLGLWTLPEITSAFHAVCLPLAPKFFTSFQSSSFRRSSGYQRHDHPINNNLPDSHRAAVAAAGGQRSAKKSWTGTGKTAVNTDSSEFELADTAHIVQRIDISTKFENRD